MGNETCCSRQKDLNEVQFITGINYIMKKMSYKKDSQIENNQNNEKEEENDDISNDCNIITNEEVIYEKKVDMNFIQKEVSKKNSYKIYEWKNEDDDNESHSNNEIIKEPHDVIKENININKDNKEIDNNLRKKESKKRIYEKIELNILDNNKIVGEKLTSKNSLRKLPTNPQNKNIPENKKNNNEETNNQKEKINLNQVENSNIEKDKKVIGKKEIKIPNLNNLINQNKTNIDKESLIINSTSTDLTPKEIDEIFKEGERKYNLSKQKKEISQNIVDILGYPTDTIIEQNNNDVFQKKFYNSS